MDFDRWDDLMHGAVTAGEVNTTEETVDGLSAWQRYRALAGLANAEAMSSTRAYKVKAPTEVLRRAPEAIEQGSEVVAAQRQTSSLLNF